MTSFGPTPIPPTPGAVQSSLIAQQANAPRARDKNKPQDADNPRRAAARGEVRDEVRLSDPIAAQAIDAKPDAAEEWKNEGGRRRHRDTRTDVLRGQPKDRGDDSRGGSLDIKA